MAIDETKLRQAFKALQDTVNYLVSQDKLRTEQVANLQERMGGLETLNVDIHGKEAVEFHQASEKSPTMKAARKHLCNEPIEGVE